MSLRKITGYLIVASMSDDNDTPPAVCKECKALGLKSKTYPGGCTSTMMACIDYYDEDGNYHNNKCNTCTCTYRCSNGHYWHASYNC